jgi:hypothetical protein
MVKGSFIIYVRGRGSKRIVGGSVNYTGSPSKQKVIFTLSYPYNTSFTLAAVVDTRKDTRFSPRPFSSSTNFSELDGASVAPFLAKQNIVLVKNFSIGKIRRFVM